LTLTRRPNYNSNAKVVYTTLANSTYVVGLPQYFMQISILKTRMISWYLLNLLHKYAPTICPTESRN